MKYMTSLQAHAIAFPTVITALISVGTQTVKQPLERLKRPTNNPMAAITAALLATLDSPHRAEPPQAIPPNVGNTRDYLHRETCGGIRYAGYALADSAIPPILAHTLALLNQSAKVSKSGTLGEVKMSSRSKADRSAKFFIPPKAAKHHAIKSIKS